MNPTDGFVVHGNIYVADPSSKGGLIGNNFPGGSLKPFTEEDVKETVMCTICLCKALSIKQSTPRGTVG